MFNYATQRRLIDLIATFQIGTQEIRRNRVRHFLRQGLLAVFLALTCTVPVMAASVQLSAIVEPASQEHHIGKLVLVELVTPDLTASNQFCGGLFGWTAEVAELLRRRRCRHGKKSCREKWRQGAVRAA
jgi:hypothetical protein